jgi:hypothetical protein
MELHYAVERLYDAGWTPTEGIDLERLDDGRAFPSVASVQREFAKAGLELTIKHNLMFKCCRATWTDPSPHGAPGRQGTVIGACPREAAVYALAQWLNAQTEQVPAEV